MEINFLNMLQSAKMQVENINFMLRMRKKIGYFVRKSGKMKFTEAIYFIMKNVKRTLQIELSDFFIEFKKDGKTITKQAFSQLREKIRHEAFIELNDSFINLFYKKEGYNLYKKYRLLAIDGSITEVPNTEITKEYFGFYNNQSKRQLARAMVSVIYDIENDIILESDIGNWKNAERDVAKKMLLKLEKKGYRNDLFIFDRGYPSRDFITFLESKNLKYLIRIKRAKSSTVFDNASKSDQVVNIDYRGVTNKVRVVNIILETGEIEKLITNVFDDEISVNDFKELYFKRWGIEVKYNQLKGRYELENFSGYSPTAIKQDFYASIYLSNLMTLAKKEANEQVKKEKSGLKYEYKVNMNILISKIRKILIVCFLTDNEKEKDRLFDEAMSFITKNLVPIRPNRSFPRKEPPRKNKFSLNRKRVM